MHSWLFTRASRTLRNAWRGFGLVLLENSRMSRYSVHAKPGSSKGPLVEVGDDGVLTVFLSQRAVDGAANEALIEALANHFGVRKTDVTIVRGHTSRHKIVEIDD